MNTQSTASRLPLPPVAGPRNAIAQREPPPIRPNATKPARNLTKLSTRIARSPVKHWTSAPLAPPKKNPLATPTTLVCLRCASAFLKPIKPARNHALLTHPNLTISRKTLEIRPDLASRKKWRLAARSVGPDAGIWPSTARTGSNGTEQRRTTPLPQPASSAERSRTCPNRPERSERANTQGSSSRTPKHGESILRQGLTDRGRRLTPWTRNDSNCSTRKSPAVLRAACMKVEPRPFPAMATPTPS